MASQYGCPVRSSSIRFISAWLGLSVWTRTRSVDTLVSRRTKSRSRHSTTWGADDRVQDPRLFLLILNRVSGSGDAKNSLSLFPSNASKYADVPFKPGEYVIPKGGLLGGSDKPGQFSVLLSPAKTVYEVSEDGKLGITKFDKTGIAGTFSFRGVEGLPSSGTAKSISVSGKFDFHATAEATARSSLRRPGARVHGQLSGA